MPRTTAPKQVLACPKCDFFLESPIRLTGAWCPNRHTNTRKSVVAQPLKVIWDKQQGGEPPRVKR